MSALFKGPWLHWGALLLVLALLGYAGVGVLHVRGFALFLLLVLSAALGLVLLLARWGDGERPPG